MVHHLRQYELIEKLVVQDWKVEIRERLEGAHKGDLYNVFVDADNKPFYTLKHGCNEPESESNLFAHLLFCGYPQNRAKESCQRKRIQ